MDTTSNEFKRLKPMLDEILKVNKNKKEIFYSVKALDTKGNNSSVKTIIQKFNNQLFQVKAGYYLKFFDSVKVKIMVLKIPKEEAHESDRSSKQDKTS